MKVIDNKNYNDDRSFYNEHPDVKKIECTSSTITIYLKNNNTETYDLNDKAMMKSFSKKYGAEPVQVIVAKSVPTYICKNETVLSPTDNLDKSLRVINNNKITTLKPNPEYVHVIIGSGDEMKIDSIPVKKLNDKNERENILKKYGIN